MAHNLNSVHARIMPVPYSVDLHWRVVWIHLDHQTTIQSFWQTGDIVPQGHQNGPPSVFDEFEKVNIESAWNLKFGNLVSESTICLALKYMGCTR